MNKVIIAEVVESGLALCISEPGLELEDIKFNKKYNYDTYKGLGESKYRFRVFHDLKSYDNMSSETFFRFFRIVTPDGLKSSRGKSSPPDSTNNNCRNCFMEKCDPVEMRRTLAIVNVLKKCGIGFIPIPVMNKRDMESLSRILNRRLLRFYNIVFEQPGLEDGTTDGKIHTETN